MPRFDFICEECGEAASAHRPADQPPRFCSRKCQGLGFAGVSRKPSKYVITPEKHRRIERLYKSTPIKGAVAELAKKIGLPRWRVSRYAIAQGWIAVQKKEPNWNPEEIRIMKKNARLSPSGIGKRLKAHGYARSETAVILKRKRMRLAANLNGQAAHSLAECLGVESHFILRAIKLGKLNATRRGTDRTAVQGGDMWYITDSAIKDYIVNHMYEIDIRKVDKYWFVDLLTGRIE